MCLFHTINLQKVAIVVLWSSVNIFQKSSCLHSKSCELYLYMCSMHTAGEHRCVSSGHKVAIVVASVTSVSGSITASPRHALIMPIYSPAPAQCPPYILQYLPLHCLTLYCTILHFFYNTGLLTLTSIILHYLTPSCIIPHYLTILAVFHLTIFCIIHNA